MLKNAINTNSMYSFYMTTLSITLAYSLNVGNSLKCIKPKLYEVFLYDNCLYALAYILNVRYDF